MLNSNNTSHAKGDQKHSSSRLKRILHCKSNVSPMPPHANNKDLGQRQQRLTQISSPVLQHSTTLYSLASPTRTSFEIKSNSMDTAAMYYDLYQPLSPPPPVPIGHGRNPRQVPSSISSRDSNDTTITPSTRSRRSHSLHHNNHPIHFTQSATSLPPLPPTPTGPPSMKKSVTITTNSNEKKTAAYLDDKNLRRHSCSSTANHHRHCSTQQQTPPMPSPSAAAVAAALASIPSPTSPSTPSLLSSATSIASSSNSSLLSKASLANKGSSHISTDNHHQTPSLSKLEKSRSTPLRPHSKIKTYNVSPSPSGTTSPHHRSSVSAGNKKRLQRYGSDTTLPSASQLERDLEKKMRQQELEDLISGRRGSTLKLSLTPKNTLLN